MREVAKIRAQEASSLRGIFNRTLERHPLVLEEQTDLFSGADNTIIVRGGKAAFPKGWNEAMEKVAKCEDEKARELFVADLDKSKDKDLFWIKRGIERMRHSYNQYGYAYITFRIEVTKDTLEKLEQAYGTRPMGFGETDTMQYKDEFIEMRGGTVVGMNKVMGCSLCIKYQKEKRGYLLVSDWSNLWSVPVDKGTGYLEVSLSSYKKGSDAKAVAVLREALTEIEAITSKVDEETLR